MLLAGLALASLITTACVMSQAEASATYVAAEVSATAILQKNPTALPTMQLLVSDWAKFRGGTLTSTDEAGLLQSIVAATKAKLTPVEAAALDGATQQILANTNTTAPTALGGGAAAIITDVMNGVARAIFIYQAPPSTPPVGAKAASTPVGVFPSYTVS